MEREIGTEKWCPLKAGHHCHDTCEWYDGEGCAIWRIVKALEKIATAQAPMQGITGR